MEVNLKHNERLYPINVIKRGEEFLLVTKLGILKALKSDPSFKGRKAGENPRKKTFSSFPGFLASCLPQMIF